MQICAFSDNLWLDATHYAHIECEHLGEGGELVVGKNRRYNLKTNPVSTVLGNMKGAIFVCKSGQSASFIC